MDLWFISLSMVFKAMEWIAVQVKKKKRLWAKLWGTPTFTAHGNGACLQWLENRKTWKSREGRLLRAVWSHVSMLWQPWRRWGVSKWCQHHGGDLSESHFSGWLSVFQKWEVRYGEGKRKSLCPPLNNSKKYEEKQHVNLRRVGLEGEPFSVRWGDLSRVMLARSLDREVEDIGRTED